MPSIDDQLRERLRGSAPQPAASEDLVSRLGARKRARTTTRRVGTVALVACVLVGTAGTFFALGRAFRTTPVPVATPSQPVENLGLDFAICRVMSMPITVGNVSGSAYVFTKVENTCPKAGEGARFVAADENRDSVVDTPPVELRGCFPPVGCEAFAAPDINGDGTSEIAVSNAGADGYGVWLFAVTTAPPAIVPIDVVDPQGIGSIQTGPLRFGWVDVAGHAEGLLCEQLPNGSPFTIFGVDKLQPKADVRRTVLQLDGSTATVIGASHERVSLSDAPVPENEMCGGALQGSAANFPNATDASGLDIGIGEPICNASKVVANFTADGQKDTAWVGVQARNGRCSATGDDIGIVAIDDNGDGLADGSYASFPHCLDCRTYEASDLDGDGVPELLVLVQGSATPTYEIYEAIRGPSEPADGVVPVTVTTDVTSMGLSAGDPLIVTAGGDEGYSFAIGCEGFPASPVLVQWSSYHPIEGPGSNVKDVYVTKLRLSGVTATVVASQHTTQPTTDPPLFDSLHSTGCGVRWFP